MRGLTMWYLAVGVLIAGAALELPIASAFAKPGSNMGSAGECKLTFPDGEQTVSAEPAKKTEVRGFTRIAKPDKKPGGYFVEIDKEEGADPAAAGAPAMPLNANIEIMIPYTLDATMKTAGKCKATFTQQLKLDVLDRMKTENKQPAGTVHADWEFIGNLLVEGGTNSAPGRFGGPTTAPQNPQHGNEQANVGFEITNNRTLTGSVEVAAGNKISGKVTVNGDLTVRFTPESKNARIIISIIASPVSGAASDPP